MDSDTNTVVCSCCDLDVPERHAGPNLVAGLVRGWRCRECNEHQGDAVRMAQDHEDWVRVRWDQAIDEMHGAMDLADDYKARMKAAFRSRDDVLRQVELISRYHSATLTGCSCGKDDCETLAIMDAPWLRSLIAKMNQRTY